MRYASIDPYNNPLARHVCRVSAVNTNPESIDMSSIRYNLDWGQSGWNRCHDLDLMRTGDRTLTAGAQGLVALNHSNIIATSPVASTVNIHIPPGHNLLLLKCHYWAHIEEFPWLVAMNGRHIRWWLSTDWPSGNSVGGFENAQILTWSMQIESFRNVYDKSDFTPVWLPEGSRATFFVAADNTLAGLTGAGGSWRIGGNGMDLPVYIPVGPPPQIATFHVTLWGILVPQGIQPPAAVQG